MAVKAAAACPPALEQKGVLVGVQAQGSSSEGHTAATQPPSADLHSEPAQHRLALTRRPPRASSTFRPLTPNYSGKHSEHSRA